MADPPVLPAGGAARHATAAARRNAMREDLQRIIDWIGHLQSQLDRSDLAQAVAYHRMELAKLELGQNMRATLPR
jgi:hypothetical protein